MRRLHKLAKPAVLEENETKWLAEFKQDPSNNSRKIRYRHKDIKARLREETGWKCVYCESKIGHNTPGDIEHKKPVSKFPDKRFDWSNLTVSCTECNRRKNDLFNETYGFIDPYFDDVEDLLQHHGPFISGKSGQTIAEIAVKVLEFNSPRRSSLWFRKIEKLEEIDNICERLSTEKNEVLKKLISRQLEDMTSHHAEFSAMVISFLRKKYGNRSFDE